MTGKQTGRSWFDIDIRAEGMEETARAIGNVRVHVKEETLPVIREAAERVASRSVMRVRPHPSNLWRQRGSQVSPRYDVKQVGTFWARVETPSGAAGRAEAISEFAEAGRTAQGASLVHHLTRTYGRHGGTGNGRILWATWDEMAGSVYEAIDGAVARAAAKAGKEAATVG